MPPKKKTTVKKTVTPAKKANPTEILGVEGVKVSAGYVQEDFLTQLQGDRGRRIYREMADNDAIISAILFAINMLIRGVKWEVVSDEGDDEMVEFAESVLFEGDMDHSWDDFITNVLSMLVFGWQYTEVVYKRRLGTKQADPRRKSKYDDGRIGIRRLADRSQETLNRWELAENGDVLGLWQDDPNGGEVRFIPINKAVLFRPQQYKGSPEGRSALRGAYYSWYFLKNIQSVEATGIERELNGFPVIYIPSEVIKAGTSATATAAQIAELNAYIAMVRDIKFNEQGGAILPSDTYFDSDGDPTNIRKVELQLLSTQGSRAIDSDKVIKRYELRIASTVMGDVLFLGQAQHGSFALSESKSELFAKGIDGWTEAIAETINHDLIPALWRLNGFDPESAVRLVPGKVAPENLERLGRFVELLSRSGINLTDAETEERLRSAGGLPEAPAAEGELESTIPVEPEPTEEVEEEEMQ